MKAKRVLAVLLMTAMLLAYLPSVLAARPEYLTWDEAAELANVLQSGIVEGASAETL